MSFRAHVPSPRVATASAHPATTSVLPSLPRRIAAGAAASLLPGLALLLGALLAPSPLGAAQQAAPRRATPLPREATVGRQDGGQRHTLPTGQVITPAGRQVDLPGMRPQAIALSPDGRTIAAAGNTHELVLLDAATGAIRQKLRYVNQVKAVASKEDGTNLLASSEARISLGGLAFSPDGGRLYLSNVNGSIVVFACDPTTGEASQQRSFIVPAPKDLKRKAEAPAGLAVSRDGRRLYVAANLANALLEYDTDSGRMLRSWPVGVCPMEVVLVGNKVYVSNSGGRRPAEGETTGPAGKGTRVRVDARDIALPGTVSIVDLAAPADQSPREIETGLHASALAVSPDGRWVVVANTGADTLHAIDARTGAIAEKFWARQKPSDLFGAQPCALAFSPDGERLYVANGSQNAVAVVEFEPKDRESRVLGLIPVGWFPAGLVYDAPRGRLVVANLKGIGTFKEFPEGEPAKFQTKDFWGTLSLVPVPQDKALPALTAAALANMSYPLLAKAALPARPGQPARPVPERVGEPSVFRHVIYVIKENRAYDQVLGDMPEGDGNPALCIFGETFTPNQHKIAREFVLLDNTYCSGVQSADGHQWVNSGIANAYTERQLVSGYPRSYSNGKSEEGADSLSWASSGFIWDLARAHGVTYRNYGEWMVSTSGWKDAARKGKPTWLDYLKDFQDGTGLTRIGCRPTIATLGPLSDLGTVGWDGAVPDIVRADRFIAELRRFEKEGGMPQLSMVFLPNDHTSGTRAGNASPASMVADNDLAFGRIVEAVSHSSFWKDTVIIAIEDDPQSGWDHISGYRTTCYVASAYTKRAQTIGTQYNQTSILRTIELILGLPPMNQLDATASPMSDCFTDTPDLTPFKSVPNQVALDTMNPDPKKIADTLLRKHAIASAKLPLHAPDLCEDGQLNEILWHAMKGSAVPFPQWAVKPAEDDDE